MDSSERVVESVLLTEEQRDNLVDARRAMYGEDAGDVPLAHVISLLAVAETRRQEEYDAEEAAMFDGMDETDLPADTNQETQR